jgi:predicted Holliday junction resolvase-like endonuclease
MLKMDAAITLLILVLLLGIAIAYYIGYKIGAFRRDRFWAGEISLHRKDAIKKSRAVLGGQFSEQVAPFLPDFPFSPTECRFLGRPVDFLVFKGADEKDINEVVFVEVKSGKSKLSSSEKKLRETIEKKRVRWQEYHVPNVFTGKP